VVGTSAGWINPARKTSMPMIRSGASLPAISGVYLVYPPPLLNTATLAISGGLSVLAGLGAAVWWWRIRDRGTEPAPASAAPASTASTSAPTTAQATPVEGGLGGRPAIR